MKMIDALKGLKGKVRYFAGVFLTGILVHGYVLTNKIPNVDDVMLIEGPGGGPIFQGRWMLGVLGKFTNILWNDMSMPWIKGIGAIAFIALSALLIIDMFDIKDKALRLCIGAMMVAFPTIAMNMTFMYLADHFCFAIFLASFAAWISNKAFESGSIAWEMISAICICASLGIYQAYFPFVASLMLLDVMRCIFYGEEEKKAIKRAVHYFFILAMGMLGYFLVNKLFMCLLGIDSIVLYGKKIGEVHLVQIPQIIYTIYKEFYNIFTDNYVGIHYYPIIRILIGLAFVCGVGLVLYKTVHMIKNGEKGKAILLLGTLVIYPASVNLIYLMVVGDVDDVYAMMVYAVVTIFLFPVILLNKCTWKGITKIKGILIGIIIIACVYYTKLDNDMYLYATLSHNAAISYYTQMASKIVSVEGYESTDNILLIGEDTEQESIYNLSEIFYHLQGIAGISNLHNRNALPNTADHYLNKYCSLPNVLEEDDEIRKYYEKEVEQYDMKTYPANNSIIKIDDMIIIRLGESD